MGNEGKTEVLQNGAGKNRKATGLWPMHEVIEDSPLKSETPDWIQIQSFYRFTSGAGDDFYSIPDLHLVSKCT
jgi:hypothetical protein